MESPLAALCRFSVFFMLHSVWPGAEREQPFNLVPGVSGLVTLPPLTSTYGQGYTRKRFKDRREGGILVSSRRDGYPSKAEPVCSLVKRPVSHWRCSLEPFDSFHSLLSHRALIVVCISVCVVVCKTVAGLPRMTRPQLNYFFSCASCR